jgi:purine nucleotide phosphorylase
MNDEIARRAPGFRPRVAVVLGSGLGSFVDDVRRVAAIPYGDLPGFPATGVASHAGQLVLGHVGPTPVAVLQGRAHYYEHGRADAMKGAIDALAELGCETMLLTNAAGSLRADMPPGSVMAIADHINFTGVNPLFGESGDRRFVDMADAYDPGLRAQLKAAGAASGIVVHEGVYVWFSGPSFETPAEIRAARILGGDAVGMSTAPETILARHAGLKVAALSLITNYAAGMTGETLSHAHTMALATASAGGVRRLIRAFLENAPTPTLLRMTGEGT